MTNPRPEIVAEPPPSVARRRWLLAAAGLLLLHLGNPLFWRHSLPVWWFPPVGIGLVLVAWLGPRAVLLVFCDILLVSLQARLADTPTVWGDGWRALRGGFIEAVLISVEVLAAWSCYRYLGRGSRRLGDPRSAILFLLLVPSLTVGAFAVPLGVAAWRLDPEASSLPRWVALYWLSHALGMLVLAPPLLATLTPWLVRHHFALPEEPAEAADAEEPRPMTWQDGAQVAVLGLALALLSLIQARLTASPEIAGWQLWGLPMLVIVWASLRHGLRGGTIMAACAVGTPLLTGLLGQPPNEDPFREFRDIVPTLPILQANLLAECATALLAAAASNWIRLSEARYRQVVTRIPVVLYSARAIDRPPGGKVPRAEVVLVSPAARTLLGADPAKLLGDYAGWLARVLADDREVLRTALGQMARGAGTVTCEYRLEPLAGGAPEGRSRWVRDTLAPQYGPAGELEGWDGVVSDITEQRTLADDLRRTLEVVRASEETYRELVETLPIMLVQFDGAGRVSYMNPAARAATGYGPEDLRGDDGWETIAHAEDLPKARAAVARALAGGTERLELRYRAKDGAEKVGYVLVEPRHQDGRVAGVLALVVDMTRERQLEADLERAQRLELIGRLASGIAHDFNNLLTVVLTLAELARTSLPDDHPARDDLRRITYAGEQAANLAHQLLAFSKQRRVAPKRIDVNRVAQRTLELLRATLPRAIRIEPALSGGDLPVQADEMQLQQVLMNLCLNARDAMPQGGRLEVRTEQLPCPLSLVPGDERGTRDKGQGTSIWVRLSVQDEGEGIPEELQGRIFDPFFTTKERGTGLGLAMVRQIVEGFGGRVEVSSRPGEGARFEVWLPREDNGAV